MSCPTNCNDPSNPNIKPLPIQPIGPSVAPCDDKCSKRTNVHCCEGDTKCRWNTQTQKCSYNIPSWVYQVIIWLIVIGCAILTWYLTKEILLGVLVIVLYIVFLVMRKVYGNPNIKNSNVPSKDYMQYIGGVCPDQWTHIKSDDMYDYCENTYGLTMGTQCYTDNTTKTKHFPTIKGWPPANDALTDRCNWRETCGPKKGTYASWTDLNCP